MIPDLTGLTKRNEEAVLIAMGPSRKKIIDNPRFAEGRSVATVNRAFKEWPRRLDYMISYHAEWMERWYFERELLYPTKQDPSFWQPLCIVSGNKRVNLEKVPHVNITKQIHGLNMGGTSSLLGAIVLLSIGYSPVHIFGVDLNGPSWEKERKFWKILKDEPLIFYGEDWFHKRKFTE